MQKDLFGNTIPVNTEEAERLKITTTILYFNDRELREFRRLTKEGMKKMYPETFQEENFADFLLTLLKEYNEK